MPLRWQEVAVPLMMIISLLILKHVPAVDGLPLARAIGVVAFFCAAILALRLVQSEEALQVDGWAELRPSMAEYFACYGAVALVVVLMSAVMVIGDTGSINPERVIAAVIASMVLGAGAALVGLGGLFVKVRWNNSSLEHQNAFGIKTAIVWADVRSVKLTWRGIVITTHNQQSLTVSQFHSGAAQLASHAATRARRNAESATKAFAL